MLVAIVMTIATSYMGPDARAIGILLVALVFLLGIIRFATSSEENPTRGIAASALHGEGRQAASRSGLAVGLSAVAVGDLMWSQAVDAPWSIPPAGIAIVVVVALFVIARTEWGATALEAVALVSVILRIFVDDGPVTGFLFMLVAIGLVIGAFAFGMVTGARKAN